MLSLLIDNKADVNLVDSDGWNALDMAVIRMQYKAAKFLVDNTDLQLKPTEEFEGKLWRPYDIDLFYESLNSGVE